MLEKFGRNNLVLCLGSIGMDHVICKPCCKEKFYKRIIGKCPFHGHFPTWSFSYISFVKFHVRKIC